MSSIDERKEERTRALVFRYENREITLKDYYKATKCEYQRLLIQDVRGEWENMIVSGLYEYHKSPLSSSEYLIAQDGTIYRKSCHWGKVASCRWDLVEEDGVARFSNVFAIGKCHISQFEPILLEPWLYVLYKKRES